MQDVHSPEANKAGAWLGAMAQLLGEVKSCLLLSPAAALSRTAQVEHEGRGDAAERASDGPSAFFIRPDAGDCEPGVGHEHHPMPHRLCGVVPYTLFCMEPIPASQEPAAARLFDVKRPRDAAAGFSSGAKSVVKGVAGGLLGVVAAPALGAQQGGALGFAKGCVAGQEDSGICMPACLHAWAWTSPWDLHA